MNKVERYLDRVFETPPKVNTTLSAIGSYVLLTLGTAGLAYWAIFAAGPAAVLTTAHALVWVFVILNCAAMAGMLFIGFLRAIVENEKPIESDRLLFASEYRGNFVTKFIAWTDTPIMIGVAATAGWPVALAILVLQQFAELVYKYVNYTNRKERREKLEAMDEAELHSLFATKEEESAVGRDIDNLFRVTPKENPEKG